MVNKVTASITRSWEEPNLKRPMIPLRFISKPAELGTTHGLAQLYLKWGGGGGVWDCSAGFKRTLYLCALWSLGPLYFHLWSGGNSVHRFPRWYSGKESTCQCRRHKRHRFDPWVRTIPWSRKWQPTPILFLGKFHSKIWEEVPWSFSNTDMPPTHLLLP